MPSSGAGRVTLLPREQRFEASLVAATAHAGDAHQSSVGAG